LLSFALPLLAAYAVSHLQNSAAAPDHSQQENLPSAGHLTFRRRPWAIVAAVWLLLLATMIAVIWYAKLHPARDENWTLTWKNGLSRALFLSVSLTVFYLYNRLSANPSLHQRGASTPQVSSGARNPTAGRGFQLQPPVTIAVGLALILCLV